MEGGALLQEKVKRQILEKYIIDVFMFIQILYFMWCKDELRAASIS
jgi:hypothetical protein